MKKHTATRISKGIYNYRGYTIKSFDQRSIGDWDLRSVVWEIYASGSDNAIEIAPSLGDAKLYVNVLVAGGRQN